MKKQLGILALAGALFFSSCLTSLHPLYTPETEVFESSLLGLFKQGEESLLFEEAPGGNFYKLTYRGEEDPMQEVEAHLVKLGAYYYLDFQRLRENDQVFDYNFFAPTVDAHNFARVSWDQKQITLLPFDGEKIEQLLKQRRARIRHEQLKGDQFVLTARPEELQQFVLKYGEELINHADPWILQKSTL